MIKINLPKAKEMAHEWRRAVRTEEFAPLDTQATIPSMAVAAEEARQAIREKYDVVQVAIDNSQDEAELKQVLVDNAII
jgi:N-methylhydantoinase B/oxoprolinase/acetone carboxylase alpha subunit